MIRIGSNVTAHTATPRGGRAEFTGRIVHTYRVGASTVVVVQCPDGVERTATEADLEYTP